MLIRLSLGNCRGQKRLENERSNGRLTHVAIFYIRSFVLGWAVYGIGVKGLSYAYCGSTTVGGPHYEITAASACQGKVDGRTSIRASPPLPVII